MRVGKVLLKFDDVMVEMFRGESICGSFLFFNVYNSNTTSFCTLKYSCGCVNKLATATGIGTPERVGTNVHPSFRFMTPAFDVTVHDIK